MSHAAAAKTSVRIASLDQFRGYTVAGMLLVNFLGGYAVIPAILKHHNTYCSYADTIMPQFFFAVGFAFRLTYLRRLETLGVGQARWAVIRRNLGLILIGFVLYHLDGEAKSWEELKALGLSGFFSTAFQKRLFQTLVHIALTSLWVLPVIASSARARVLYLTGSAALHIILSQWFWYDWLWKTHVIDGGQLGFLTWSIAVLVGSLAYDVVAQRPDTSLRDLILGALVLMGIGYGLTCVDGVPDAPPFVPPWSESNLWTMSQRSGSVSYQTFAAGFSLLVYALFVVASDRGGWESTLFRAFGRNALAAYILHGLVADAVKPYLPRDAPAWYVVSGFLIFFAINYVLIRGMEKQGAFLRL